MAYIWFSLFMFTLIFAIANISSNADRLRRLQRDLDRALSDSRDWQEVARRFYIRGDARGVNMKTGNWKPGYPKNSTQVTAFTREDYTALIQLCHPDKHGGKQSAVVMTQKLNNLRSQLK